MTIAHPPSSAYSAPTASAARFQLQRGAMVGHKRRMQLFHVHTTTTNHHVLQQQDQDMPQQQDDPQEEQDDDHPYDENPRNLMMMQDMETDIPTEGSDHSMSSTFDVASVLLLKTASGIGGQEVDYLPPKSPGRRVVSFDESQNHYHPSRYDQLVDDNDTNDLLFSSATFWYDRDELSLMKHNYTQAARNVIRLENAWYAVDPCHSYRGVVERVHEAACCDASLLTEKQDDANGGVWSCYPDTLSSTDAALFAQWIQSTTCSTASNASRLGLERAVCRRLRQDKYIRRKELTYAVLELQMEGFGRQELAVAARRISHPSRQFARCLAQAQAMVSPDYDEEEPPHPRQQPCDARW